MEYEVTYSCGHSGHVGLEGTEEEIAGKLEWMRTYGECAACFTAREENSAREFVAMVCLRPSDPERPFGIAFDGVKPSLMALLLERGYEFNYGACGASGILGAMKAERRWNRFFTTEGEMVAELKALHAQTPRPRIERQFSELDLAALEDTREFREALAKLQPPEPPGLLAGHTWTGKVYGRPGEYEIRRDGERIQVSDAERNALENYITRKRAHLARIEELRRQYGME